MTSSPSEDLTFDLFAKATIPLFTDRVNYGGYVGWEQKGDRPMTLKTKLAWSFGRCSLNAMYQVGFMDWPFHQIRLGVTYSFPLNLHK